jgi:2-methylcitrate dehydratase PrpD
MGPTQAIAEFATRTKAEENPPELYGRAKRHVVDTLGVALAASHSSISAILGEVVQGSAEGESSLWNGAGKSRAADAAWVNGALAHALDFDDGGVALTPMHPSAPVLPAVLALAESRNLSGGDSLCAYIVGVEVECKLASLISLEHYHRGWHSTAILGTLGAAVGSARLLRLAPEKLCHAIGIASSMAGGVQANFGSMTKPLHAGQAARNGVLAALLAEKGFTANPSPLEAEKGMIELFGFGDAVTGARMRDALGQPFHFLSPGVSLKRFPTCTSTHLCLEAVLALRRSHLLVPDQIAKVECAIHELDFRVLLRPDGIRTAEQARFSLEYAIAVAIRDGEISLRHFVGDVIQSNEHQGLMRRVRVFVPPELQDLESRANRFGDVKIYLTDGSVISHRATQIRGQPPLFLTEEEVDKKFLDCTDAIITRARAQKLLDILRRMEAVPNIREIFALLPAPAPRSSNRTPDSR